MFLTDLPHFEEQMAMTVSSQVWPIVKKAISSPENIYTVCSYDFADIDNDHYSVYGSIDGNSFTDHFNQIDLITIANSIFGGSKPLATKETEILNNAFLKSIRRYPTKL